MSNEAEQNYQRALADLERLAAPLEAWRIELGEAEATAARLDDERLAALVRGGDAKAGIKQSDLKRAQRRADDLRRMRARLSADVRARLAGVADLKLVWLTSEVDDRLNSVQGAREVVEARQALVAQAAALAGEMRSNYMQAAVDASNFAGSKVRQDWINEQAARLLGEPAATLAANLGPIGSTAPAAAPVPATAADRAPLDAYAIPGLYEVERN